MSKSRGVFITFEGGEGAGKTTQIRRLASTLGARGHDVVVTREPGGTPEAEKIRDLLVRREGGNWSPVAECMLLFAGRAMHVRDLIEPALEAGKIVLCDRFTDSTRAYQAFGHGFPLAKVEAIKQIALGDFEPDLTLIFDIEPETGIRRSEKRLAQDHVGEGGRTEDRFERLDFTFHRNLRSGYLRIAEQHPERCRVVDASLTIEQLETYIRRIVLEALP